jgi:V/A-type H+-transporting ATPase subunit I
MAIVPLEKVTLYGPVDRRPVVLEGLQTLGCLHLVDLAKPADRSPADELVSADAREALRYLNVCPVKRRQTKSRAGYDHAEVDAETLAVKHGEEELNDERDHLEKAIADLKPWGDFHLPTEEERPTIRFWFYVLAHRDVPKLEETELTWQVVGRDSQFEYVVVLSEQEPEGVPGPPAELDRRPLSQLEARLEEVEEKLEELHWQRVGLTRWCSLLTEDLDAADDRKAREVAQRRALQSGPVFAVQAWCPRAAVPEVRRLAERERLAVTVEPPEQHESPPTLLRNPERVAGAEGAVTFYITPGYHAWDPTTIVYFSFSLFFAMIIADAGYGLVFAGVLWALRKKLGRTRGGVRVRSFLSAIVVTTILYGVLVGSYFGVEAPGLLARLQVLDVRDQGTMMALAIVIGVAHLVLANLVSAWQNRKSSRCLVPVGWAAIMLGGLVAGAAMMGPVPVIDRLADAVGATREGFYGVLEKVGTTGLVAGGLAVFLFSSERPLRSLRLADWAWRVFDGLQGLTGITKAFGDVLSYLRLFALGLASAQLAATFNGLAADAAGSPGPGVLLAVVIIVVGHGINILLGIMSGVVHGLRLNCIEFFNWSLKEEGNSFQPFSKKADVKWTAS